jgi:Glyoxalase superfamily protein/Clp amino terminal domain, pathogenicity island component
MRDFRDAKAMAHTVRSTLATQGHNITNSQSLELIAKAFGAADWNTLSAAIRAEPKASREGALPLLPTANNNTANLPLSRELASTLPRALEYAKRRRHQYATIEHLLLALIDDADAAATMKACDVDFGRLTRNLTNLSGHRVEGHRDRRWTCGFAHCRLSPRGATASASARGAARSGPGERRTRPSRHFQ